jgi:hypothetical protein
MVRRYWQQIYIDREPANLLRGWGWIEILVDDAKRLNIPNRYPDSYTNYHSLSFEQRLQVPGGGNLPSKGKAGTKKFVIRINGESIPLRVQKSLTISAVCAWLTTWANSDTQLITPGGRTHQLDGNKVGNQAYFIYFIFNADSNAIKIGRAKNVSRRLQALQTSSPAMLNLLRTIPVEGLEAARELEHSLHQRFHELRLNGEWFRADTVLRDYIGI